MAQENQDSKVVIATVISNKNDTIELTCEELGRITIVKGKNWDGGIYWDGKWRKELKFGDKVDLLCMYANSVAKTPRYGIYVLGSLLDSPAKYYERQEKKKIISEYMAMPEKKAVVLSAIYQGDLLQISAYNPAWGCFSLVVEKNEVLYNYKSAQSGNEILCTRCKNKMGDYVYVMKKNLTLSKMCMDFDKEEFPMFENIHQLREMMRHVMHENDLSK